METKRPRLLRAFERIERWLRALLLLLLIALILGQAALSNSHWRGRICPVERMEGNPVQAPAWTYEGQKNHRRLSP